MMATTTQESTHVSQITMYVTTDYVRKLEDRLETLEQLYAELIFALQDADLITVTPR